MTWEDKSSTSLISAPTRVLGRDDSFWSHYSFSLNPIRGEEVNSFHIAIIFFSLFIILFIYNFHLPSSSFFPLPAWEENHYSVPSFTTPFLPSTKHGKRTVLFVGQAEHIYENFSVPNLILQLSLPHLIRSCSLP